jgi:uncharacterized damage-inducible protein DinB
MTDATIEAWLRGPVPDVPDLLMPAAHALIHAQEDAARALDGLSAGAVWAEPAGAPSVGYHVRHLVGALDRLLTYARDQPLSVAQRAALDAESQPPHPLLDAVALMALVHVATARALAELAATDVATLLAPRGVGRSRLPSTVWGLLFHAAEHSARHAGQALTTARIVRGETWRA